MGVTYDTGALLAAEAGRRDVWALHARVLARGELPVVPVGVLGQAWRGGPQPQLSRFLRGCQFEELTVDAARAAGALCARARVSDLIDASVVVGALLRNDLVLTSDPDDLERLAAASGRRLQVHRV